MIKRFKVERLNGNDAWTFDMPLHKDINVFTGKNGAGKTTVLKLLWYLISGNIERIFPEISFSSAFVEGDGFKLEILLKSIPDTDKEMMADVSWCVGENNPTKYRSLRLPNQNDQFLAIDNEIAVASGSSVFFPTFRRIEGGFSLSNRGRPRNRRSSLLQEGMTELSEELTFLNHSFVSSIATDDIESLLTSQYAKTSDAANSLQAELSTHIEAAIKGWEQVDSDKTEDTLKNAQNILSDIKAKVRETDGAREVLLKPFTVLTQLIGELLKHKGIRVTDVTTFGDVSAAIEAGHLSAGEKQMFSFLCYNAFGKKTMIFIDEPEISLHVDWQRILFPKLMEQASDNQFIISTHSPFIYSKYTDKELVLDTDRGEQSNG